MGEGEGGFSGIIFILLHSNRGNNTEEVIPEGDAETTLNLRPKHELQYAEFKRRYEMILPPPLQNVCDKHLAQTSGHTRSTSTPAYKD